MKKKTKPGLKIICLNRKASFNYFFEDLLEAGIVLKGSEIKSIREGKINITDSYMLSNYLIDSIGLVSVPGEEFNYGGLNLRLSLIEIDIDILNDTGDINRSIYKMKIGLKKLCELLSEI